MIRWVAVLVILAAVCGCQSVEKTGARFGKDLLVVACSPAHIPYAGVADVCGNDDPDKPHPVTALIVIPLNMVKHLYFTAAYGIDALLCPLYLPFGLEPWNLYTIDGFPFTVNHAKEEVMLDPMCIYQ